MTPPHPHTLSTPPSSCVSHTSSFPVPSLLIPFVSSLSSFSSLSLLTVSDRDLSITTHGPGVISPELATLTPKLATPISQNWHPSLHSRICMSVHNSAPDPRLCLAQSCLIIPGALSPLMPSWLSSPHHLFPLLSRRPNSSLSAFFACGNNSHNHPIIPHHPCHNYCPRFVTSRSPLSAHFQTSHCRSS